MSLVLVFILIFVHFGNANLINRINNDCEPPPVPTYLPDAAMGSYCRFSPAYSTLDFVFLIDACNKTDDGMLTIAQNVLYNSLKLTNGRFSNSSFTNNAAFIYVANISKIDAAFGDINDPEDFALQFKKLISWKNELQNETLDLSGGLQYIDENIFDYTNGRGKLLTVIANNVNQKDLTYTVFADKMKQKGVEIFTIGYNKISDNLDITDTYFQNISTTGWYFPLLLNSSDLTSNDLSTAFQNYARQTNCICPPNSTQFSTILSSTGPPVKQIYSDCIFNSDGEITNRSLIFDAAVQICRSDTDYNSRAIALNSSTKYQFVQGFLSQKHDSYWTGKQGEWWITYSGTTLPVEYLPDSINDTSIQQYCKTTLNITSGESAALIIFNGTYVLCSANPSTKLLALCEKKALDAFDNPKLCPSPFIDADVRPQQIGSSCSMTLFNMYLDLVVIVDISKHTTPEQLAEASKALMDTLQKLNFDISSPHSSRLSLIVYSSVPAVKAKFGDVTDAQTLAQKFNFTKYRNPFDKNQNALPAFKLAQTMLVLNKSHRRQGVIFITSGINNASDPYLISESLKSAFDVRIVTMATYASEKIDRISSPGMNLQLGDQLQNRFSKSLGYVNCFCPKGLIQFVDEDKSTNQTNYYSDCLRGYASLQTPNAAFDSCKKLGGVPISLTSAAKSRFIQDSKIFEQIQKSPVFTTGLRRHAQNINQHEWVHFANSNFSIGSYPPRIFNFDDINNNCSMALTIQEKTFITPISCEETMLPFVCQIPAYDGDRYVKNAKYYC